MFARLALSLAIVVCACSALKAEVAVQPSSQKALELELGNQLVLKLVQIPAGKFLMGSPPAEKKRVKCEGPQHEVTLTKPFYMGVYMVTQEQYAQVMGHGPTHAWRFTEACKGPHNPVEGLTWDDAVEFCKTLSAKSGKTVRLPTEAEWEYACRAGTTTAYCNGDDEEGLKQVGWCSYDGKWASAKSCKPVGTFAPNAWGLYDMHGNVWEWCSDWYADSYKDAKSVDPQGPDSGTARVIRGGVWFDFPWDCRSAKRESRPPAGKVASYGVRIVIADAN